ncbi:hypothetical protein L1987_64892 [Smallanthus sonchifolius]|uniref:Uncharacterized protein n=1 Tax=Smallanthus sonchifolius TaxID=185202 RepID=A0ACB9BST9_9ASTR|nr:hypothetical protein L1987_64892 [Smallanthus sonchifolius]
MLPFNIKPIFKPFINETGESKGTYDDLLKEIENKTCEAVAGDVTVRAIAILEFRVNNPKFMVSIYRKVVMVIWFPISTFFFHEGQILNRNSKVVLITWLSMIFIIVQIFTATLSSWLTLDQMRPRLPLSFENVGYQYGSYLNDYITQKYNCSGNNLVPLKSIEEFKDALSSGSVNAVFDELPYVELFLAKYGSSYMKFGPINQESGLAFVRILTIAAIISSEISIGREKKKIRPIQTDDLLILQLAMPTN